MPESRHRRKGRTRPRPTRNAPPVKNPPPSPAWVPVVGVGALVVAALVIFVGYLDVVTELTSGLPLFGANWNLVLGFVLFGVGFAFLSKWR